MAVLATKLGGALITHQAPDVARVQAPVEHQLPCFVQTQLPLELQRAHARDGAKMPSESGWTQRFCGGNENGRPGRGAGVGQYRSRQSVTSRATTRHSFSLRECPHSGQSETGHVVSRTFAARLGFGG